MKSFSLCMVSILLRGKVPTFILVVLDTTVESKEERALLMIFSSHSISSLWLDSYQTDHRAVDNSPHEEGRRLGEGREGRVAVCGKLEPLV